MFRLDNLTKEPLEVKDINLKNLQTENEHLRIKVPDLDKRVIFFETKNNNLEQYGRQNDIYVNGIKSLKIIFFFYYLIHFFPPLKLKFRGVTLTSVIV